MTTRRVLLLFVCMVALSLGCGSAATPAPPDDAGSGGTGPSDAGTTDAGSSFDGGATATADAGNVDGGNPDAGNPDAGNPDGGNPDGGDADAGSDAGPAATACPTSFEPLPTGPAAPPVPADAHAGELLKPAWEIRAPAGWMLRFGGTVDSSGNLYWLELKDGNQRLASAKIDGTVRFRVATAAKGDSAGLLIASETVVSLSLEDMTRPVATGYSTATGEQLWRRELLPLIQGWYRETANNSRAAVFDGAVVSGGAVVLALGTGYKTESGYLALDGASGSVLWVARTTDEATLSMASPAALSEDGALFGSQILRDHTAIFRFSAGNPPALSFSGPKNEIWGLLAAPGPVLFLSVTNDFFAPSHPEVRCQDGALIARFDADVFFYAASSGNAWVAQRSGALSQYDVRTGRLKNRVQARPGWGAATSSAGVLWVEQSIEYPGGASSARKQGAPTLRVLGPDGSEALRRALPQEPEAYNGTRSGSFGDRILFEGEVLPSAGSYGVIRAIDVPGWSTGNVDR
ncbi:MAG TPA: hypothetical protein VEQ15_15730 [Myxococcales bacterium]|nr:hypothetical protein [Myxococcales bacterium]